MKPTSRRELRVAETEWIGASRPLGGPRTLPPAVWLRREFRLDGALPKEAEIFLAVLGLAEIEINGQAVTEDVFIGSWTDYRRRVVWRSYPVADLLRPGRNVVGVILGDGWYSGHVATDDRQVYGDRPLLCLRLAGGGDKATMTTIVATDRSWKWTTGPILENDLLMGEVVDGRLSLGNWTEPCERAGEADEDIWFPVRRFPGPEGELVEAVLPSVRRQERLPGTRLPDRGARGIRYDFGQNLTGRVRLRIRGPRGARLTLRHAEVLNPDGSLYTENLRSARAVDQFILAGTGTEEFEPRFTFHGFRYGEIEVSPADAEVEIETVEGVVLHNPMQRTGWFSCSNPLLNKLTENIVWGQKGNFLEVPTDCPQRDERLGWTGDAQVFVGTAAIFMDVRVFFRKWLQDLLDAQESARGAIPPTVPFLGSFGLSSEAGPGWSDAIFICPWELYQAFGDKSFIEQCYHGMRRYMEFIREHRTIGGIREHPDLEGWRGFGDWLALDGSSGPQGRTPRDLIGTAFHARAAEIMAASAELLGRKEEAGEYRLLHGKIREAFVDRFVTEEGLVFGGTQTAYILPLQFGLLPEDQKAGAVRELVRLIEENGCHLGTGFLGTPYILDVLESHDHLDLAYRLLEQESFPSWLFPVKQGATTIWERWDGWTPEKGFQTPGMNSFNHYAYGAVGAWMVRSVAGLAPDPENPAPDRFLFRPRPGGSIDHAGARYATGAGEVSIRWERKDADLRVEIYLPESCTARFSAPPGAVVKTPLPDGLGPGSHEIRLQLQANPGR
ncbi:MAG: family 78 glycoside hydrolase catalytic domain [Verrucomicrobia bacterium]|jgi:alpha-L-rhamnosidase|nr:family 78 glycoside hydrolase catalytic domain [Verrucomicrobiota bacterium]